MDKRQTSFAINVLVADVKDLAIPSIGCRTPSLALPLPGGGDAWGWRGAWVGFAALTVGVMIPLGWLFFRDAPERYGLTPEAYKERWDLPPDYPMVAPSYAQQRSILAKKIGLGTKRRRRRRA